MASNLFAIAAVVFAIIAIVLYLRPGGSGVAPIPTAAPGGNQIVNVSEALKAQGLEVQQPPRLFIPAGKLAVPGQGLEINGYPAFVFLFEDAAAAQAAASADPNTLVPERLAGTPAPAGERRMVQGSNVVLLLVGGDDETWQKVERAVGSLA
jgi:hypothetical protein